MSIANLAQDGRLIVKQRVEGLEAITGVETRNRYEVLTPRRPIRDVGLRRVRRLGQGVPEAQSGSHPAYCRPWMARTSLVVRRGFFWLFPRMDVQDGTGRPLGTIRRKFGLLKRRLVIEDARGETVAEVSGSVFRRYTFMVNRRGEEIGRITKQWSGVGREMFTDADTFLVELPVKYGDDDLQYLVLATAFAVDLDFFES